jgi:hypothetical protein
MDSCSMNFKTLFIFKVPVALFTLAILTVPLTEI